MTSCTRFADCSRGWSLLILMVVLLMMVGCLLTAPTLYDWDLGLMGVPDQDLYRAVVERVHGGEGYYAALEQEFDRRNLTATSLFNWRFPSYAWALGSLPSPEWGRWLLVLLSALACAWAGLLVQRDSGEWAALAAVLLLMGGTFAWCFYEDVYLTTELWGGVLLLLSLCTFDQGWWPLGVALAVAALLLRELALLYCLVALAQACMQGRRREVVVWLASLAIYASLFSLHHHEVARHLFGDPALNVASWLPGDGLRYVLATCRMNLLLRPLPGWVMGLYLPLALLGLAGWNSPTGLRVFLTAGAYASAFLVVGKDDYWGLLYAPLLIFGIVRAPVTLRELVQALVRQPR